MNFAFDRPSISWEMFENVNGRQKLSDNEHISKNDLDLQQHNICICSFSLAYLLIEYLGLKQFLRNPLFKLAFFHIKHNITKLAYHKLGQGLV